MYPRLISSSVRLPHSFLELDYEFINIKDLIYDFVIYVDIYK